MSTEFKVDFLKRFGIYNRAMFTMLIFLAFFVRGAGFTKSNFIMIYYPIVAVGMILIDEYLFNKRVKSIDNGKGKFPAFLLQLRTYLYIGALSAGAIFTTIPAVLFVGVVVLCFYIVIQDILFCDIFNTFFNTIRIMATIGISTITLFFIQFRHEVSGAWFITFIFSTAMVLLTIYSVYIVYYETVKQGDEKYTKLFFVNTDLKDENEKLIEFREKVEKVNSEINYQRINLTRVNDDLEKTNEETRSLIEVMKYFSASFNVEKNAHVMMQNIMDVKKAGAVGFFIDRGTFMNEDPYIDVISVNEVAGTLLKQDLYEIFTLIQKKNIIEPLILCENYDFKYPFLTGGNICNAVAFPAFENESIYGVMVVTSSKYEFFVNGYSFYESSVMDFTSALISDRLYLKTEDMAKKDGLTKIYNRIYFNQFFPELKDEVVSEGARLTVAMMDIDHFKNVNDTYGHLAGDEVIKMVAKVDDKFAKLHNGTAVRFGGEEFLLILKDVDIEKAHGILEEMHQEIVDKTVEFEDLKIKVNVSMGLASYPETCDRIDDVVDKADQALYYSKEHGRGRITIDGKEGE